MKHKCDSLKTKQTNPIIALADFRTQTYLFQSRMKKIRPQFTLTRLQEKKMTESNTTCTFLYPCNNQQLTDQKK